MKYLVMECHRSYAVVLDQEGRFLKVANMGYETGQELDEVIEAQKPKKKSWILQKHVVGMLSAAACLCLVLLGSWQFLFLTYGTVRMQINPEVQIAVNRLDYVTELEGLNEDGEELIEGISVFGKKVEDMTNELADRAMELGFLKEGGQIALQVDSTHEKWRTTAEDKLLLALEVHFDKKITIVVPAEDEEKEEKDQPESKQTPTEIKIPVVPSDKENENTNSTNTQGNTGSQSSGNQNHNDDSDDRNETDDDAEYQNDSDDRNETDDDAEYQNDSDDWNETDDDAEYQNDSDDWNETDDDAEYQNDSDDWNETDDDAEEQSNDDDGDDDAQDD